MHRTTIKGKEKKSSSGRKSVGRRMCSLPPLEIALAAVAVMNVKNTGRQQQQCAIPGAECSTDTGVRRTQAPGSASPRARISFISHVTKIKSGHIATLG